MQELVEVPVVIDDGGGGSVGSAVEQELGVTVTGHCV